MVVRINSLLLLAIIALTGISHADAAETARARFLLTIDAALVEKSGGEQDSSAEEKREPFVPCEHAIVGFAAPSTPQKLNNETLKDWATSISKPVAPQDHAFQIEDGDYFPKAMTIRAGDSLIQTKETGRMYFEGMIANPAFGVLAMPGTKYTFQRPERTLIKVVSNPNAPRGGPSREAYLFVVSHTCVSISNDKGIAELSRLPMGVEIPMQVFYPWGEFAREFKSSTLEFEKNKFSLVCDQVESVHHILITARKTQEK